MSLCRHYVRELRRSVLVATPDMEKNGSKRSSMILEQMGDLEPRAAGPSMFSTEKERNQDAQMSAFLREDQSHDSPQSGSGPMRPSPKFSSPRDVTDSNSPSHTVNRQDIRASAEKILYTFLLPGAEREITLPGSITHDVTTAIEEQGRDDPEVFDVAKDYVFQAMERDAFPGFLRMKALGNLIPPTLVMRLIIGLVSMFGAFWAAFILIFLDKSRATKCWVSFPFHCMLSWLADIFAAHPAILRWRLFPGVVSVFLGSNHGVGRPQRVHAFQLFAGPRALRPPAPGQARRHGFGRHGSHRCGTLRSLHSRPGQASLSRCPSSIAIPGVAPAFSRSHLWKMAPGFIPHLRPS